jgi:hypothetical protein
MKFGFKLGRKEKEELEEEVYEEELVQETEEVVQELVEGIEPVKPHPPLQELSLDADLGGEDTDSLNILDPSAAEEEGEPIKLVEVQPNPAAAAESSPPAAVQAPAPEAPKEPDKKNDPMDLGASISSIFTDEEDEENPLINLIKSLPEVAAAELIDDLKEINDIIKDWQKK